MLIPRAPPIGTQDGGRAEAITAHRLSTLYFVVKTRCKLALSEDEPRNGASQERRRHHARAFDGVSLQTTTRWGKTHPPGASGRCHIMKQSHGWSPCLAARRSAPHCPANANMASSLTRGRRRGSSKEAHTLCHNVAGHEGQDTHSILQEAPSSAHPWRKGCRGSLLPITPDHRNYQGDARHS